MRTCSKIGGVVLATLLVLQAISLSDAPAQQAPGTRATQPPPGTPSAAPAAPPAAAPTAPAAFPLVQSVSPVSLMQGQAYTLTVVGQNLQPSMQLVFAEGIMIKGPLTIQGPTAGRVDVQIASGAPPGRYEVKVRLGQELRSSQAFVMIMAAPPPPSTLAAPPPPPSPTLAPLPSTAPPPGLTVPSPGAPKPPPPVVPVLPPAPNPAVASLTPNQWAGGQSYTLTLFGANFASGMEVRFGEGIQTKGTLTVKSATTAEVAIDVVQSAKAGKRTAEVRTDAAQQWASTGASGWVVAAAAKPAVDPKYTMADTSSFVQGIIKLKEPEDYYSTQTVTFPINDDTVFKWEETNPGLAEWFELRIVTDQGTALMKRRLNPVQVNFNGNSLWVPPTYYRPDKKFFDEMFFDEFHPTQYTFVQGLSGLILYWEVAGYRGYETIVQGPVPGQSHKYRKEVEIEKSDRRALATPDKPTGLACKGTQKSGVNTTIQVVNLDQGKNQEPGKANVPDYTLDRFQASGEFTLSTSPYASHYAPNIVINVGGFYRYNLSNIFIDWGDGTIEQLPLDSKQKPPYSGNTVLRIRLPEPKHVYTTTGQKVIRIFQLPEGDIQHIDPGLVVGAYEATQQKDGSSKSQPYYSVLQASGVSLPGASGGVSYADLASHAYMIFCQVVTIDPRKDLVASGLLHLESIDITGYNSIGHGLALKDSLGTPAPLGALTDAMTATKQGEAVSAGGQTLLQPGSQLSSQAQKAGPASEKDMSAETLALSKAAIKGLQAAGGLTLSKCDILQANATLTYYGQGTGKTHITWSLELDHQASLQGLGHQGPASIVIKSEWVQVGPSPQRDTTQMTAEEAATPSFPGSYGYMPLDSNILNLEQCVTGKTLYLKVSAKVNPFDAMALSQQEMLNLLSATLTLKTSGDLPSGMPATAADVLPDATMWRAGSLLAAAGPQVALAAGGTQASASAYLSAVVGSGAKIGILSPLKTSSGLPVVAQFDKALKQASVQPGQLPDVPNTKPYYVESEPFGFGVVENTPEVPCKFLFTTKSNDVFTITNLKNVTRDPQGRWSGAGSLELAIYQGTATPYKKVVPIPIKGWTLDVDGLNAAKGSPLDATLNDKIETAGMKIVLGGITATAKDTDLDLTLSVTPQDTTVRLPGTTNSPVWKASERLTAQGDWFHQDNTPVEIAIGWSGFTLVSSDVAIDLSATKNHAAGSVKGDKCTGAAGNGWAGIHFGHATLQPFLANLSAQLSYVTQVSNWGVLGGGLCGNADFGSFSATVKGGSVSFDGIHAATAGGNFDATYKNMTAKNPWPGITVTGTAQLVDEKGKDPFIDFTALTGSPVTKNYKLITLSAQGFTFGTYPGVGWGIKGNTTFGFSAEGKTFAPNVPVNDIVFGMDGIAYLQPEGTSSADVVLGGKTEFGPTPADLVSVTAGGFGSQTLTFDFTTLFSVSTVMPPATVPVGYTLEKKNSDWKSDYAAQGPFVSQFTINVAFPQAQSQVEAKVTLNFTGTGGGTAQGESSLLAALGPSEAGGEAVASASDAGVMLLAANGGGDGDRYSGSVDLSMYGSPLPTQIQFRLGYKGSEDYWLFRTDVGFPGGIVIVPEILSMYALGGGLGHNFRTDAFKNVGDIMNAVPETNGSYLFMARMRVGSGDSFLYMFDGTQTISSGGSARLDFGAWLLTADHGGQGAFQGYLEYAGGSFDGGLSGKLSLLNDAVYIDIPDGAATLHFGGGSWYMSAGKKSGPRLAGHVLVLDANAYLEMGLPSPGFLVGAGTQKRFSLGDCDGFCAYIDTYFAADLAFTPNPLHVSGGLGGGASAGICFDEIGCPGFGVDFSGNIAIWPPLFEVGFSVSVFCPVDSIGVSMRIIPPGLPDPDVDWCDFGIF